MELYSIRKGTFNLPDCRNRVPMMLNETIYTPDSSNKHFLGYLPNIVGELGRVENVITGQSGAFYRGGSEGSYIFRANSGSHTPISFDASRCSTTYGWGGLTYNNVIPASVLVKEIIKYI